MPSARSFASCAGLKINGDGATTFAASPVPVSDTDCGKLLALSATLRLAELVPVLVGVKLSEILQLEPAASVVPQALLFNPNALALVPVTEMEIPVKGAVPVFINTTTFEGELVVLIV
jgi:hypothetical protein